MKRLLAFILAAATCGWTTASDQSRFIDTSVEVERMPFGSGTPDNAALSGRESAAHVMDGLYHVPNYLPGFPTAASIWPKEVQTVCALEGDDGKQVCSGYRVSSQLGRGEYIYVRPVQVKLQAPEVPAMVPTNPEVKELPRVVHKKPLG